VGGLELRVDFEPDDRLVTRQDLWPDTRRILCQLRHESRELYHPHGERAERGKPIARVAEGKLAWLGVRDPKTPVRIGGERLAKHRKPSLG